MNPHIKRYKKLIKEIIAKDFPELKDKKFRVIEYNFTKTFAGYVPIGNLIGMHKRCRPIPNKKLKSLIVHELCHASLSNNFQILKSIIYSLLSNTMNQKTKEIEFETDKLLIRKGYARQRIELIKLLGSTNDKRREKYYMNAKQIESYAKKIGKW